jgi:hypothetical protein
VPPPTQGKPNQCSIGLTREGKKKRREPLHRQRPNVVVGVRDLACAGLGGEGYIQYVCTSCNAWASSPDVVVVQRDAGDCFGIWCLERGVKEYRMQNATVSESLRMNKTARHTPASLPKASTLITKAMKMRLPTTVPRTPCKVCLLDANRVTHA